MKQAEVWPGAERRYPKSDHPGKHTLDRIREEIISFSKSIPSEANVLDFGCGEMPYYPFFKEKANEYIGIDISDSPEKNSNINTIIRQGEALPYPDSYFNAVISTQVFEHLEDMDFYAKELGRVLKKDGQMFVSAPFVWDFHPYPKDYWRISEDGYRKIFKNFSEIDFSHDSNSFQCILQSFGLLLARRGVRVRIIYIVINYIISKIDHKKGDNMLPANIFVRLRK
jgi:SAM-dependent methyltransferase